MKILSETNEYDDIAVSVIINQLTSKENVPYYNEIDVLAIRNSVPIFIECKTRAIVQDDIYKLTNLRKEFGSPFSQAVLISTVSANKLNKIKAQKNNVIILDNLNKLKSELTRLHEYMVTSS